MSEAVEVMTILPFWRYAVGPSSGRSAAIPFYRLASAEVFFAQAKRELPWSSVTLYRRVWPMGIEAIREYEGVWDLQPFAAKQPEETP